MNRLKVGAMLLALAAAATAGEMEDRYEQKLQKEFAKNASWITDYDEARATAKKENKPIFAYFTRSYSP